MTNQEKFDFLYKNHSKHLLKIARRYCKTHSKVDGEDLAQDTWIKIYDNIDRIDVNSPYLKTYLTKIAMFTSMVFNKKATNRIYFTMDKEDVYGKDIKDIEDDKDLNDHVDYIINNLVPARDRKIFRDYIKGVEIKTIAKKLDYHQDTIYVSIRNTKAIIKNNI